MALAAGSRFQRVQTDWGLDDGAQGDPDRPRPDRDRAPRQARGRASWPTPARRCGRCCRRSAQGERTAWRARVAATKAEVAALLRHELAPQHGWIDALRAALPEDGILVEDLTQIGYVARLAFPVHGPRQYLSSGYQGTLGLG